MWGDGKWVFTAGSDRYQSSGEEPVSPILTNRSQVILQQSNVHRPRLEHQNRRSLQLKCVHVPPFSPQYGENRMSGWLPPSPFKINSIQCSHYFSYCPTFRQDNRSYSTSSLCPLPHLTHWFWWFCTRKTSYHVPCNQPDFCSGWVSRITGEAPLPVTGG